MQIPGTLYVVGGTQKVDAARKPEWKQYRAGRVLAIDLMTGKVARCADYVSPAEFTAPEDPSVLLKAASISGGTMYACTSTEILLYELASFHCIGRISHPWLNDVHHVRPTAGGTLLVANTGLDMVVELDPDGSLQRYWSVTGADPFERFDRRTDYRRVATTKPHASHPNFVFELDGRKWATLFLQREAVCLEQPGLRIEGIAAEGIHDGVSFEDGLWFTSVDGSIVRVDARTLAVAERYDLNAIMKTGMPLGWCRGIEMLDRDHAVVGFSRLRPTRIAENIRWVKWQMGARGWGLSPTRLACIDLRRRTLVWEHEVESSGVNSIFSIHFVA